ncbi:hypothetical protein CSW78_28590, partial [Shigella flexneri]
GKRFERTANSQELKDKYANLDKEQLHDKNETATIAGRLITKRGKGKRFERTANSQELKDKYANLDKEQLHDKNETAT